MFNVPPIAPCISTTNRFTESYCNCPLTCPRSMRTRLTLIFYLVQSCVTRASRMASAWQASNKCQLSKWIKAQWREREDQMPTERHALSYFLFNGPRKQMNLVSRKRIYIIISLAAFFYQCMWQMVTIFCTRITKCRVRIIEHQNTISTSLEKDKCLNVPVYLKSTCR